MQSVGGEDKITLPLAHSCINMFACTIMHAHNVRIMVTVLRAYVYVIPRVV